MEEHRKAVGVRIRALREAQGLSQEDLAHLAGVTTKTISRWENGKHSGYGGNLKALAQALGVEQREILGDQPAPFGLGAREEQVENGFEEFREHVKELLREIKEVHARVDDLAEQVASSAAELEGAKQERIAIERAVTTQNENLQRQDQVLLRIERALGDLPAVQAAIDLLREGGAAPSEREDGLASGAELYKGPDRRRRNRRAG